MNTNSYEVFKAVDKSTPIRLGSVNHLTAAIDMMNRMAARIPGAYFVLDSSTREVVASVPSGPVRSEINEEQCIKKVKLPNQGVA
jgi:hypothetical protein